MGTAMNHILHFTTMVELTTWLVARGFKLLNGAWIGKYEGATSRAYIHEVKRMRWQGFGLQFGCV